MQRNPREILPLHGIHDAAKLDILTAAMENDGWVGRPVLCLDFGDRLQALTGSHRLAAAQAAGLDEVPVCLVDISDHVCDDNGDCVVCGSDCWVEAVIDGIDDCDRLNAIRRSGDETAIRLMEAEFE